MSEEDFSNDMHDSNNPDFSNGSDDNNEFGGADNSDDVDIIDEYDDVDMGFVEDQFVKDKEYEVWDDRAMNQLRTDNVKSIKEILNVNEEKSLMLLYSNFWDQDKIISSLSSTEDKNPRSPYTTGSQTKIECPICMDKVDLKNSYAMGCGHVYCNECWKDYLRIKLTDGSQIVYRTGCPNPRCTLLVYPSVFKKFLDKDNLEKFDKYLLDSFVSTYPNCKWCPSPDCAHCVHTYVADIITPVQCNCGFRFCFQCHDFDIGDHAPAGCEEIKNWLKKASDESENMVWMMANTKKCPKCRSHIEKNGGCMHMSCKKCTYEFCWLCRGDWKKHSACNKSEEVIKEETQATNAKNDLEHYMFYWHRYDSHKKSMRIASKQRKDAQERGEQLMNIFHVRAQDVKFLAEAADQLIYNRNMLQNSYVYSYYLSHKLVRTAEKNLFEFLQQNLESNTDKLSEEYELDIESKGFDEFIKWKESVTNHTRVSKKFFDNFVEGVIKKTLIVAEGETMTEDERFYFDKIEQMEVMGIDRQVALPLLKKFDGNIELCIQEIYG